jgi:hypothetical protein
MFLSFAMELHGRWDEMVWKFIKNLLTGPDGDSFSVSKTGAALVLLTCLFVAMAETAWLLFRHGTLISDWIALNQSLALFIPTICGAVIALVTLQSSNEGGVLKAHGIPPTADAPEKE